MEREEAIQILKEHIKSENLIKHSLATEAIMVALAERLGKDRKDWALAGLLHDLDYEYTQQDPKQHGRKTLEILSSKNLKEEIAQAILAHNGEALNIERKSDLDYALTASETITGLIVASALVHPDKKISSLSVQFVKKRMKSKDFARNVSREHILFCEHLGLDLDSFIELSIKAMATISDQLGL